MAAGGHLYITNEEGHSHVVGLGPEYKLLAENDLGETVMAHRRLPMACSTCAAASTCSLSALGGKVAV